MATTAPRAPRGIRLHATSIAVARNRLVLGLAEVTGGIWVLDNAAP
jgi:hypothetical protein